MKSFFKKLSIIMIMLTALYLPSKADVITVPLVQGTLTTTFPFYSFYMDASSYYLYPSTEIVAAGGGTGVIKSIALNIQSLNTSFQVLGGFKIFMQNTTATTVTAPVTTGWQLVYSNPTYIPLVTGWETYAFATADQFNYDATKNLLVKICFNNSSYTNNTSVYCTATTNLGFTRYNDLEFDDGCTATMTSGGTQNRPNVKLDIEMNPKLITMFPPEGTILSAGSVVDAASINHPAFSIKRTATQPQCWMTYTITGPSTNPQVIYRAAVEGTTTYRMPITSIGDPNPFRYNFTHAYGIAAHSDPGITNPNLKNTGRLDLSNPGIPGGEYTVTGLFEVQGYPALTETRTQKFIIALPWDITVGGITQPVTKQQSKYPLIGASGIPVRANVMNIGTSPVDSFSVQVTIYKGTQVVFAPQPILWINKANPLLVGQVAPITFPDFRPSAIGDYSVVVSTTLLSSLDLDPSNNIYPKAPNQHIFQVSYGTDAKVESVIAPAGQVYLGRPIVPTAKFSNQGVEDISEVPATMVIKDPMGNVVFDQEITVQSIPFTGSAATIESFLATFVPQTIGTYTVTTNINPKGEGNPADNTLTTTFTVIDAMSGVWTISASGTGARNFPSFETAVEALYERGVSGPVVFELPDADYYVGHTSNNTPAIDFRSKIVGVDATNTIIFRPSNAMKIYKGGITINLSSASGIGFIFGQTSTHNSPIAPVNSVYGIALKRLFANSEGYITFDGGDQKTLKFKINTPSTQQFRTAFYMAEGSKNITVKNCLIEGQTSTTSLASSLPQANFAFITDIGKFTYQENVRTTGTFSAGVLLRNKPPFDVKTSLNYYQLDTIQINNINIENNEISNFGYGVVSMGIGMLNYVAGTSNTLQKYYNHNNTITHNTIYNVGRAGVFAGYEENSVISYNRIYNVNGTADAAGIILGGEKSGTNLGYNNIGVRVVSNEISNVMANTMSYGIKVEQTRSTLQESVSSVKRFPAEDESITVANNVIWDIKANLLSTARVGIYLATDRNTTKTTLDEVMITPMDMNYFTRNDKIVNNTIVIPSDNGAAQTAPLAGIAIMQAKDATVYNNAIAILDMNVAPNVEAYTAIFYNGVRPNDMDNKFDRNAFWLADPTASYYRFVETKANNEVLNIGFAAEFTKLSQWFNWTGSDANSVVYNFMNDMVYKGTNPATLRVKTNPTPIGSKLNNRGEAIEGVNFDIDGDNRGLANQRYDIGADEFDGRIYTTDLEVAAITYPRAYTDLRSTSLFNDAEYIMTKAPIEVKSIIRNNGSLLAVQKPITVQIFREDTLGNFPATPVLTKTVKATIASTDDIEVAFGLADGLDNDDFTPLTYTQLTGYTVPNHFKTMKPNVTPRHRVVISLGADEVPSNNVLSDKIVRFYLKRAGLNLLLSLENSHETIVGNATPTPADLQKIAGRLNADTLVRAFNDIGWYQTKGEADHDFDLFERMGWEVRSVNYPLYRTLIWSDANDKKLTISEINNITDFVAQGTVAEKKNFIIASQEVARENGVATYPEGNMFLTNILRVAPASIHAFMPPADYIKGLFIARNITMDIIPTGFLGDVDPNGDIVSIYNLGNGLSRIGLYYTLPTAVATNSKIMSVATSNIYANVVYSGLDWRHYANAEELLRGTMDYIENNGGTITPVELLSFNADAVGNRVEMNWNTASEINSARFDIERANVTSTGVSNFAKIDEKDAKGNTNVVTEYGPVIDRNVNAGASYAYRLKMIDFDGNFNYSNEKIVTMGATDAMLSIGEIVPNPAVNQAKLTINMVSESAASIEVFDMSGRMVVSQNFNSLINGINYVTLDTKSLASGSYRIVLNAGNSQAVANLNVVK